MKNKIMMIVICIILLFALSACGCNESENEAESHDDRITCVYSDGWAFIYKDNETGVQYFSRSNCGTCVMVNADGTPYIGNYNRKEN